MHLLPDSWCIVVLLGWSKFFFSLVPFFFHFGSFGPVFVIAIFRGKNAYFLYGEALEGHQLPKNPTHAPPAPVGGALRNVRHAEGRS